jgi:hypothetical protein
MKADQARVPVIDDETNMRQSLVELVAGSLDKMACAQIAWDKFGTKIVSMRFISVHIGSLTVRLQPE